MPWATLCMIVSRICTPTKSSKRRKSLGSTLDQPKRSHSFQISWKGVVTTIFASSIQPFHNRDRKLPLSMRSTPFEDWKRQKYALKSVQRLLDYLQCVLQTENIIVREWGNPFFSCGLVMCPSTNTSYICDSNLSKVMNTSETYMEMSASQAGC
jgi:hypothetical protein